MSFSEDELNRIRAETFVAAIEYRDEAPSTNDLALELARQPDCKPPLLVLAGRQTAGRGRGVHRWWSAAGSLTFTLVVDAERLSIPVARTSSLSPATALAMRNAIAELAYDSRVQLKWPNDVFLDGRKACGILVEAPPQSQRRIAVGVGLNVNNCTTDAPLDVANLAVSLRDVTGLEYRLPDLLIGLLQAMQSSFACLSDPAYSLRDEWQPHCLLTGTEVRHRSETAVTTGRCFGIDDDGALLLETATAVERFLGGEIAGWTHRR